MSCIRRIEKVTREHIADVIAHVLLFCCGHGLLDEIVACERREVISAESDAVDVGICGCAHTDNDVAQLDVRVRGAAASDAYYAPDSVLSDQFGAIDRCRWNPHAMRHHGHRVAFVLARESPHVADVGHAPGAIEVGFGNVLRTQRITGHQHRFGEIAGCSIHVFGSHSALYPPGVAWPPQFRFTRGAQITDNGDILRPPTTRRPTHVWH